MARGRILFTDWCGHVMHPHTPTKQFDKFLKSTVFVIWSFMGWDIHPQPICFRMAVTSKPFPKTWAYIHWRPIYMYMHLRKPTRLQPIVLMPSTSDSSFSSTCVSLRGFWQQFAILFTQLDSLGNVTSFPWLLSQKVLVIKRLHNNDFPWADCVSAQSAAFYQPTNFIFGYDTPCISCLYLF